MYNIYTILILNAKKFMIRNSSIMSSLLNKTLILVYVCTNSSLKSNFHNIFFNYDITTR